MSGKATRGNNESKCMVSKIVTVACAAVAAAALVGQDDNDDGTEGRVMVCKAVIAASAAMAAHALVGLLFTLLSAARASRVSKEPDDDGPWSLHHHETPTSQIGWTKPEFGWVKLNVDGSRDHIGTLSAGCGGVLRDATGTWLHGFAQKLDPNSKVHVTEIEAILKGLLLAWEMNVEKLVVESDHEPAVSMVANGLGFKLNHPQFGIISRIRELRSDPKWEVKVVHIPRDANQVANRLARDARDLPSFDLCKYRSAPPNCTRLVLEDKQSQSVSYY